MYFIKNFHLLIGFCAIFCAVAQQLMVVLDHGGMKPFNPYLNWKQENTMLSIVIFISGVLFIIATFRNGNYSSVIKNLICPVLILTVVSFGIFQRNFTLDVGILTLLSLLDGLVISIFWFKYSHSKLEPLLATSLFASALTFYLLFLNFGVFNAGS